MCGNSARTDLCGGRSVMGVPTANPQVTRARVWSTVAAGQRPRPDGVLMLRIPLMSIGVED